MQRLLKFYIALTFCLSFCEGNVKTVLEEDLKKTNREIYEVMINTRFLIHELEFQNKQCYNRLRAFKFNTNARKPKFQNLVIAMSSHWADIYLMNRRKEELIEAAKHIEKLQLGIEISALDILQLEERRSNGLTEKCLFLEGMAPAVHVPMNSLSDNDESPEEAMIVLQNKLRVAQSKLSNVLFEKMEKKTKKRVNEALCGLELQRLNEALQKLNTLNDREAIVAVNLLALKLQMITGEVKQAAAGLSVMMNNLNVDILKSEAKKETREHKRFVSEKLCYAKLTEHLSFDEDIWKLWNEPWLKELINDNPGYDNLDSMRYFPMRTW